MANATTSVFDTQISYLPSKTYAIQRPTDADGNQRIIADSFTLGSTVGTTETLNLCVLPKGVKVVSLEMVVPATAGAATSKIGVGILQSNGTVSLTATGADDDILSGNSTVSLGGAGGAARLQLINTAVALDYVTTQECVVVVCPGGTALATGTYSFVLEYVCAN
jgi:hypothetical protein